MDLDPMNVIVALLVFAVGAGLGFWLGTARQSRKVMQAGAIKAEYEEYREQVMRHFGKAAEHFQTIGREYRALYEHMASGADALCAVRDANDKLQFVPGDGEPDGEAAGARSDADEEDAGPRESGDEAAAEDAAAGQAADGRSDDAEHGEKPPAAGSATSKAAEDGPRAEQDGPAAGKPERTTYH